MSAQLNRAVHRLNSEISKVKNRSVAGLMAGALVIQADAQRRVPIHYGNLRGSAYTRKAKDDPNSVEVGFTAAYAVFVHENLEAKLKGKPRPDGVGEYWGPNGRPQFLLSSALDNRKKVVDLVRQYARQR